MARKKSELEIAAEVVESLVTATNNKINELGTYTYSLYQNLNMIQTQFDKIRNIPSDKRLEFNKLKKIRMEWKKEVEKIEDDYRVAQKVNVGGGAAGTGLGIGVATLGPTAAMGIATTFGVASTGTAISALSGAAATNAALAWLGGGALAAGGGGMAAGNALLALAGPIGWTIAGLAIVGSGLMLWKTQSDKKKLNQLFILVSERDQKTYRLAITEINERIARIIDETAKLIGAIIEIGTFGLDYDAMTEDQQYCLGSYVNLMNSSTQLLVNPIMGLIPKVSNSDFNMAFCDKCVLVPKEYIGMEQLIIYLAGLLYDIPFDKTDFKLLTKSLKKNKDFLNNMNLQKDSITENLFDVVVFVINYAKSKR